MTKCWPAGNWEDVSLRETDTMLATLDLCWHNVSQSSFMLHVYCIYQTNCHQCETSAPSKISNWQHRTSCDWHQSWTLLTLTSSSRSLPEALRLSTFCAICWAWSAKASTISFSDTLDLAESVNVTKLTINFMLISSCEKIKIQTDRFSQRKIIKQR